MTAETAFLDALASRLSAAGLQPAPALVGSALPVALAELPALVLSLDDLRRQGAGLGERASLVIGALPVSAIQTAQEEAALLLQHLAAEGAVSLPEEATL